ncbi:hypothetical protein EV144_1011297 [Flavobacterium sp. 270]|uniref:hypothetical protein n=1 Tax=Flavobacterium sp. 270 TaxID=2512114 RepID=UPI0010657D51|nr:hypothetical protein [Flavobacterium sp. 270]TDW52606.1 hypothetical protein EV144_1011297 [Flavobacterium sp. 270]
MKDFELWLEFEEVGDDWKIDSDFCNIHVYMKDGRKYGLNVWTYDFVKTAAEYDKNVGNNLNGLYLIPPDLLVEELTRNCIEKTIQDLLTIDDLEKILNPSIVIIDIKE